MAKQKATQEETTVPAEAVVIGENTALTIPEVPKLASLLVGDQKVNKELLTKRIKETDKLLIKDSSDTAGYKAVNSALAEFRTTRTTLEKKRKESVAPLLSFMKDYKTQVDELGAICAKQEAVLAERLKVIDDEKERIKKEKEQEKIRQMQARVASIVALGAVLDPESQTYLFAHEPRLFTSDLQLQEFTQKEYEEFVQDAKECWDAELARIQKEKEDKEAEDERIRLQGIEQAAEATRLNATRTRLRIKELTLLGFTLNEAGEYRHPNTEFLVLAENIETITDENWDAITPMIEQEIEDAQNRKEAEIIPEPEGKAFFDNADHIITVPNNTTVHEGSTGSALVEVQMEAPNVITDIADLFDQTQFAMFQQGEEYEDLHIAAKFFLRVYMTCRTEESLDVLQDRIISKGTFRNSEVSWALIKL